LQGKLGGKLFSDLIREVAERNLGGLLRVSHGTTTRCIYFDEGSPILATSNLASEQIEYRLLKENRTTPSLIERARSRVSEGRSLGQALIEMGLVTREVMLQAARELSMQIISSLFEAREGEYSLDECATSFEPPVLDITAADCLIQGVRAAAGNDWMLEAKAPMDRMLIRVELDSNSFASSANLTSIESYILSRIISDTPVSEVGNLTGLPEEDARRAVCVLVSLGLLALEQKKPAPAAPPRVQRPPDPLLLGITRKLETFESADYYQILGVTKLAPISQINDAYRDLQNMFATYRAGNRDNVELQSKLDTLFAKIAEAHETLSDPQKRWAYDQPTTPRRPPAATRLPVFPQAPRNGDAQIERGQTPSREPVKPRARVPLPEPTFSFSASSDFERGHAAHSMSNSPPPIPNGTPGPSNGGQFQVSSSVQPGTLNAIQGALHLYRQARTKYEQHDLHAAEHLFREACKLDPSQPHYHYHLAVTLMILSQARHSHAHHEGCHVTCNMGGTLVSNPRVRYEAERHFLKALEIDPSNAQIMVRLGLLYKEARLYKKAEHFLRQTLMIDSKNQSALKGLEEMEQEGALENRTAHG
jgi:tetratricopeptide (TPR) repeat protein